MPIIKKRSPYFMGNFYVNSKDGIITDIIYKQDDNWTLWGGLSVENLKRFIAKLKDGDGHSEGFSEYPLSLSDAFDKLKN